MTDDGPIYCVLNPNARGFKRMKRRAERLAKKLGGIVIITPKNLGEAAQRVFDIVRTRKQARIISVSGDGGLRVVCEAALKGKQVSPGSTPIVAAAACGTANNHAQVVQRGGRLRRVVRVMLASQKFEPLDMIRVDVSLPAGDAMTFYAHSDVGIGYMVEVLDEIDTKRPGILGQVWLFIQAILRVPSAFRMEGQKPLISWSVHNIRRTVKVFDVAPNASIDSGELECLAIPNTRHNRQQMLRILAKALLQRPVPYRLTRHLFRPMTQSGKYWRLVIETPTKLALDGDTRLVDPDKPFVLQPGTIVEITCEAGALDTLAAA